jgi:hypothetical protein
MNYMLIPTLLVATVLFATGVAAARRAGRFSYWLLCLMGFPAAVPGMLFAAYYLKFFGEPVWFYEFRSLPLSELSAGGAGFFAGLLHGRFERNERFRKIAGRWFFPIALAIGLLVPYLKPLVRAPDWSRFEDKWSDSVCLQTSESSCGPACGATLLHRLGKTVTEREIAEASFTSRNGTENWYLARALRDRGCDVRFVYVSDTHQPWPFPAIAGVRLPSSGNNGHFIAILGRDGDKYVIGDPLEGRLVRSQSELRDTYDFTGFFMVVQ